MAKKIEQPIKTKWEYVYEDEDTISIWKYDAKISMINPYSVEMKYKNPPPKPKKVKRTKLKPLK